MGKTNLTLENLSAIRNDSSQFDWMFCGRTKHYWALSPFCHAGGCGKLRQEASSATEATCTVVTQYGSKNGALITTQHIRIITLGTHMTLDTQNNDKTCFK